MPYDSSGSWVPEWPDDPHAHIAPEVLRLREIWRDRNRRADFDRTLDSIAQALRKEALDELGRDAARAQRDALFYWNALEQTKMGGLQPSSSFPYPPTLGGPAVRPSDIGDGITLANIDQGYLREQEVILDSNAGRVLTRLRMLGLTSASWPTERGGPPAHTTSRPFRKMIEWLLGKLADVGEFLLRIAEVAGRLLMGIAWAGAELEIKFSVHLGLPFPQLGLQLDDPKVVLDANAWSHVMAFANGLASGYREAFAN